MKKIRFIAIVIIAFFVVSCNIFSWSQPDNLSQSSDYNELYDQYTINIHNLNYDSAISIADLMIKKDSDKSDGYVLKAKAIRYKFFNKYFVIQELLKANNKKYTLGSTNQYIPFWNINIFTLDSIYKGNKEIKDLLSTVYDNNLQGRYNKNTIALDLIISNTIYAIISIKDLNGDGSILDDTTYFDKFSILMSDSGLTVENLTDLYDKIKDDPSVLNNTIDRVDTLLNFSTNLMSTYAGIDTSNTEKIDSLVNNISSNINKYKIADKIDNDGDGEDNDNNPLTPAVADGIDNDGDGLIDEGIDEEIINGKDDDGDGLIDEDANALPNI